MALETSKKQFNPVSERDFGLQLRCGNYYTVGTDIPSNPEEKAIIITNLRYDFNYQQSLMNVVKKFGPVEKLHYRFMKMRHIALVEFKDHKSALRFKMAPGNLSTKQPSTRKFWRLILPVPDNDAGFAAVQAHLSQPPAQAMFSVKRNNLTQPPALKRNNVSRKIPSTCSTKSQMQGSRDNFEMHVPAVVPSLEETGSRNSTSSTLSVAPKRKPMLKLSSKPKSLDPVSTNDIEIIDLEAVSQDSVHDEYVIVIKPIVIIDDETVHPMKTFDKASVAKEKGRATSISTAPSHSMDVTTTTSEQHPTETGTAVITVTPQLVMNVNTGTSQHMDVNTSTSQHMDVTTPFFTPAGLRLIPHSFKILPPPNSGMEYIITGSLRPTVGLHRNLVLRGIPYELNIESNLRLLTSFGRCKIMPRYLGLRTTAYVMYCNNIDPINCFNGAYKVLNLEYLKVFWMEKLPLPNPKDPTSPTCINEDTDEVELECAPGDLQTRKIQFKALRQKMRAYKTQRKEHAREKIDKNFRWKPSGIVKAKLIMKNQTLMSNNINSQKIILTRLESCENADTRERLMAMLKKLEKTHLVTADNLKVLSTSSEPGEQSVEQPEQQPVPTPSQPPQPEQQPVPTPSQPPQPEQQQVPIPSNPYPRIIKIVNFSDQDVLQNHFRKFGKCTVVSYVVDSSNVILCKFEESKEAVLAFEKGRELVWYEWGNKKDTTLELEWDDEQTVETLPVPTQSKPNDFVPSNPYPRNIKIVNFSDQDVLQNHFRKFGKCTVVSYVVNNSTVILCKFDKRKEAVVAFVRGREMVWSEWGNKKEITLELEWDFSASVE